ncbi:MAG: helicase HerA-like domain-containing protein, partial [Gemmobacter sp.]
QKVEQVARLIRSKGVGVYFITQNPQDVPENILGQLGNRVQHALRAFTAKDQQALRLAAQTYRPNERFNTEDAIRDVGTGEAVTSFLEAKGAPGIVERTLIRPPSSQVGPIDAATRAAVIAGSPLKGKYDTMIDRESAYEKLRARAETAARNAESSETGKLSEQVFGKESAQSDSFNHARRYDGGGKARSPASETRSTSRKSDSVTEAFAKSFARQLGTRSGQAIVRGVLGSIFGRR